MQKWLDLTFLRDFDVVGVDTQYYGPDHETPLADPIEHPFPLSFKAGEKVRCGVCENGDGGYSLEIENLGQYGTVWVHRVPADAVKL